MRATHTFWIGAGFALVDGGHQLHATNASSRLFVDAEPSGIHVTMEAPPLEVAGPYIDVPEELAPALGALPEDVN